MADELASLRPTLLTATQVANMLQVSVRSLWRMRSAERLPQPVRIGAVIRWRLEEITKWIAAGCPPQPPRENEHRRK